MSFLNTTHFLDYLFDSKFVSDIPQKKSIIANSIAEKINNNLAALRIVKECMADNRLTVTDDESSILNQYAGWGQLSGLFEASHKQNAELKSLVTAKEYAALEASILTSYYTPAWVVDVMYRAVARLGVQEGLMLDPAVGSGRFLAGRPASLAALRPYAIELDRLTGNIARLQNPDAKIYVNQPFESVKLPNAGDFSLVIGNPPYCSVTARDQTFGAMSIHNYFMVRGLTELHMGGLMAYVVSSWVMDSKDKTVRQELAARGNLVAACRLPNTVFQSESANVVTDILIFQACAYPEENPNWLNTVEISDPTGIPFSVNQLFVDKPELVAGVLSAPSNFNLSCVCDAPNDADLAQVVNSILDQQTTNPVFYRNANHLQAKITSSISAPAGLDNVGLYEYGLSPEGVIFRRVADRIDEDGISAPAFELVEPKNKKDHLRIVAMLRVKSVLANLIRSEQANAGDTQIRNLRATLNATYDQFVHDFGAFHATKNKSVLSADPWYYRLRALELDYTSAISKAVATKEGVEERAEKWTKGAIFNRRIIKPVILPTKAASLSEAVLMSASFKGVIDVSYISDLVDYFGSDDDLITELSVNGLAFKDPETSELVHGPKYLSGYVRQKFNIAFEASKQDPRFAINASQLEAVLPAPVKAIDIFVPLNARWIPCSVQADFIRHLSGNAQLDVVVLYIDDEFKIKVKTHIPYVKSHSEWGTPRKEMISLLNSVFNNRKIEVCDPAPYDHKTLIVNTEETLAAQNKVDAIKYEWEQWILDNADRRELVETLYNEAFNGFVPPKYDGSLLPLNGCALELYSSQRNAVARSFFEKTMLVDHCVGSGKTNTFIAIANELRRINPNERIVLVAPNHLISQHAVAAQVLFPGMNILVLDKKQMEPATRRSALARFAISDFDLCIIPLSVFGLIPAPKNILIEMMEREIQAMRDALECMSGQPFSIRDIQKRLQEKEIQLESLAAKKTDNYLDFNDLRISGLFVDESQFGKNLSYATSLSNVAGMGNPTGSKRAFDLYVKSRAVLRNDGRYIELTGTPILNSIIESHRHLRFMMEEYTEQAGLTHFDAFSALFAQPVTDYELAASGRGYKQRTRISTFTNLTELQAIYSSFADVVTAEQLPDVLPKLADGRSALPPLANGKITELLIEPNDHQERGFAEIVRNYANANRHENNPLKLIHQGRMLSLDARLVYPEAPDYPTNKVNTVVNYLVNKYHETNDVLGTQLIFMDRSIPARHRASANKEWLATLAKAQAGDEEAINTIDGMDLAAVDAMMTSNFSLYDDLVAKLIAAGIPEHEIAVIHDYRTDVKKEFLRAQMNSGKIRFLVGSTELMGSGLNINRLLVSLVDFDLPLRPGDLVQRHGRIDRQGNYLWQQDPNFSIEIVVPITRRTLDAWQLGLLNTKQKFITRFRQFDNSVRHYTEQQEAIDYAELSAIVADDPRILEHVRSKAVLRKLEAAKNVWLRNRATQQDEVKHCAVKIQKMKNKLPLIQLDADSVALAAPNFQMKINGITYTEKGNAVPLPKGQQPKTASVALMVAYENAWSGPRKTVELAEYKGMKLLLDTSNAMYRNYFCYELMVQGIATSYGIDRQIKTRNINGLINAFINMVDTMPKKPDAVSAFCDKTYIRMKEFEVEAAKPFTQQNELQDLIIRIQNLERSLLETNNQKAVVKNDTSDLAIAA